MLSPVILETRFGGQEVERKFKSMRPTMLVVDDEEGPRQSLKVIFKDDFQILMAKDGPTAIQLARENKIDVAVLDIRMAGMSGIEVLERLKYVDPAIEVVMMTAFETADTMRQALRLQACDYINKPFDVSTIRAAVDSAMERRSLGGEVQKNNEKLESLQQEMAQLESDLKQKNIDQKLVHDRVVIYDSIIHDINGPLTVISALLQMMNQQIGEASVVGGEDLDQVKDRLKRITRQVTNCIEISRRYLTKHPTADNVRVWVNQILADLRELVRMNPASQHHDFIVQPLKEDVAAHIHGTDLIQILLNLTSNALQCSPNQHHVEIQCQLLNEALDLSHFHEGPEDRFVNWDGFKNVAPLLAISVQDNGPGIPQDVLPKIFEPYYSSCVRQTGNGTGLGLCIVERLVRGAHGALHVHSRVGRGTVFTVYLSARSGGPDSRSHH